MASPMLLGNVFLHRDPFNAASFTCFPGGIPKPRPAKPRNSIEGARGEQVDRGPFMFFNFGSGSVPGIPPRQHFSFFSQTRFPSPLDRAHGYKCDFFCDRLWGVVKKICEPIEEVLTATATASHPQRLRLRSRAHMRAGSYGFHVYDVWTRCAYRMWSAPKENRHGPVLNTTAPAPPALLRWPREQHLRRCRSRTIPGNISQHARSAPTCRLVGLQ